MLTKLNIPGLANDVCLMSLRGYSIKIVALNCSLKVSDVQSCPGSAMIFSSDGGSGVGCCNARGFKEKMMKDFF